MMPKELDINDAVDGHYLAVRELAALRKDAARYRWLRERVHDAASWEAAVDAGMTPNAPTSDAKANQ